MLLSFMGLPEIPITCGFIISPLEKARVDFPMSILSINMYVVAAATTFEK